MNVSILIYSIYFDYRENSDTLWRNLRKGQSRKELWRREKESTETALKTLTLHKVWNLRKIMSRKERHRSLQENSNCEFTSFNLDSHPQSARVPDSNDFPRYEGIASMQMKNYQNNQVQDYWMMNWEKYNTGKLSLKLVNQLIIVVFLPFTTSIVYNEPKQKPLRNSNMVEKILSDPVLYRRSLQMYKKYYGKLQEDLMDKLCKCDCCNSFSFILIIHPQLLFMWNRKISWLIIFVLNNYF